MPKPFDVEPIADRPLATQTTAPPVVPPRRPIVGIALADDDWRARVQRQQQQLAIALEQCEADRLAMQASLAQLRALRDRLDTL